MLRLPTAIASIFILLVLLVLQADPARSAEDSSPLLRLHRGTFDALSTKLPDQFGALAASPATHYAIIQFRSPISPADRLALEATGVKLIEYLPDFAFLVRGTGPQLAAAARMPQVYARIPFTLADKLAPGLLRMAAGPSSTVVGRVRFVGWAEDSGSIKSELAALPFDARGELTVGQLIQASALDSVRWIEPLGNPMIVNDHARTIMGADSAWQNVPLYGSGQIIGITDSGLDTGNLSTLSPDFSGRIVATQTLTTTGTWADEHGHGTHVAGSAAGAGVQSGAVPANHQYTNSFAGLAPEAQLSIQAFEVAGDGSIIGIPADYYTLFDQMYATGARLHSNSWGDVTGLPGDPSEYGGYVLGTQRTDEFIWQHPSMTVFAAAGNSGVDGVPTYVFGIPICSGGDGIIDPDSLLSPGTAKNVITVGATESDRNTGPFTGLHWGDLSLCYLFAPIVSDLIADNINGMAGFSSRGPADDGRFKPDIAAPGVNIISNRSHAPGAGTLWGAYDANYVYSGGTSMATPLTAGAGAVVREWLQGEGAATPSAALVKATLLNTTQDTAPGQYGTGAFQEIPYARPNNVSGWGRADLSFMNPPPSFGLWFDDHGQGMNTGETISYTHTVTRPLQVITNTQPLRLMLVWTDPPASLSASTQLVNDLDLVVTGPGPTTYYGNGIVTGDRLNNVEGIVINNPPLGQYQIDVTAFNVPTATQPFALVVAGPMGIAPADLSLTIDDGGILVTPGSSISYTLTYRNKGAIDLTGVTISETVPTDTRFDPVASAAGWSCSPDNFAGSSCGFTAGTLPGNSSRLVTFTVQVSPTISGGGFVITNTASAGDDGSQGQDPTIGDNFAVETTTLQEVSQRCGLSGGPSYLFNPGNRLVTVSVNVKSDIDCIEVNLTNSAHPSATLAMTDGFYWDVVAMDTSGAPASGYNLDLIFPHYSPDILNIPPRICHYLGQSGWDCLGNQGYDATQVIINDVTSLSEWIIAYNAGPTAISMLRLRPTRSAPLAQAMAALVPGLCLVSAIVWRNRRSRKRPDV